ncbi:MAG: ParA family protein [Chloroflexota bacterium]
MTTKIISLAIQKGGCGKTTSTLALAEIMTNRGYKVLVIDFDPQASSTDAFGEDAKKSHIGFALDDIDPEPISDLIQYNVGNGFDLAPSHLQLARTEMTIPNMTDSDRRLKIALEPIKDQYDYIFIDSLPGSGKLMLNALTASTHVLIPLKPAVLDINGLAVFIETIKTVRKSLNRKLVNAGIFLTMYNGQTNLHNEARREISGSGYPFIDVAIPHAIKAAESSGFGQSIAT